MCALGGRAKSEKTPVNWLPPSLLGAKDKVPSRSSPSPASAVTRKSQSQSSCANWLPPSLLKPCSCQATKKSSLDPGPREAKSLSPPDPPPWLQPPPLGPKCKSVGAALCRVPDRRPRLPLQPDPFTASQKSTQDRFPLAGGSGRNLSKSDSTGWRQRRNLSKSDSTGCRQRQNLYKSDSTGWR